MRANGLLGVLEILANGLLGVLEIRANGFLKRGCSPCGCELSFCVA
jgi:hypothetical protein